MRGLLLRLPGPWTAGKLPHRIEVRYGDKRYAILTIDKYTLNKTN